MSLSATALCSSRIFSKTFSASSTPTASSARWSSPSVSTSPPPKSLSGEKTTSKSPPTLNLAALSRETSRSWCHLYASRRRNTTTATWTFWTGRTVKQSWRRSSVTSLRSLFWSLWRFLTGFIYLSVRVKRRRLLGFLRGQRRETRTVKGSRSWSKSRRRVGWVEQEEKRRSEDSNEEDAWWNLRIR